ncbi:hypothetical protein DKM44_06905 [Deinococcus irradiatisoli]|uniref:DUF7079 domain-containing protein n=1 Tax=Deinococcus irradiatisoli TaxID=2202254 RepID=A0A2Z3JD81_9DEIO|nr:hypothetical protein [Deinococcus irradiatisoli]AWN22992.1 hypothetical protein DKM44_06905 [Deinococcus irradiatisoli]
MTPDLSLSRRDLPRRRAWLALSELFLDSELESADVRRLAQQLRASGFTLTELEHLLSAEVAPVLGGNLLSVAGVWNGFDPDWLEGQILARRGRGRWLGRLSVRLIQDDWQRLKAAFLAGEIKEPSAQ